MEDASQEPAPPEESEVVDQDDDPFGQGTGDINTPPGRRNATGDEES